MNQGNGAHPLRQFGIIIYAPTLLFGIGLGALVPVVPAIASDLGADIPLTALIGSALVVGQLLGNIPAGWAVSRIGERRTMVASAAVALLSVIVMYVATSAALFTLVTFTVGFCAASFGLARHAFLTTHAPSVFRARALSLVGGAFRFGAFVGPFTAALLLSAFSNPRAPLLVFTACLASIVLLLSVCSDPADTSRAPAPPPSRSNVFVAIWRHRRVLMRLGIAAAGLSAMRATRQVLLPLWGFDIGMEPSAVALVVGLSGMLEFMLFYVGGIVMDRFGRLWGTVPAMSLMSGGVLALGLTAFLPNAVSWFLVCAIAIGAGNGLSSGTLLTLGADTAPTADPAPYLGAWRTVTDTGGALAPLTIAFFSAILSLTFASITVGAGAALALVGLAHWIPRLIPPPGANRGE